MTIQLRVNGKSVTGSGTYTKVSGKWCSANSSFTKVSGVWKVVTFDAPPPAPFLTYTADGQFTIGNYNAAFKYKATGASQNGTLITGVSNGATITVERGDGSPVSKASTMNVLANGRILDSPGGSPGVDVGCGPRGDGCCSGGTILDTSGRVCGGSPGSLAPPEWGGCESCPDSCFYLALTCYNWHWTNYSGDGYTLIGGTWGKATNG